MAMHPPPMVNLAVPRAAGAAPVAAAGGMPHADLWRVVVVDESIAVRAAIRSILESIAEVGAIETVRGAPAALAALERGARGRPVDVVLLDVEMPTMSGLEALPHLLRASPTSKIIMVSSLTRRGAAMTMTALAGGASDYLCKPGSGDPAQLEAFRADLATKIGIWSRRARHEREAGTTTGRDGHRPAGSRPGAADGPSRPTPPPALPRQPSRRHGGASAEPRASRLGALAIGSSTGGPQALMQLFGGLAAPFACPVFLTQHMPQAFTALLAEQLGRRCRNSSREAVDGEPVAAGRVYVAPGDHHMVIEPGPTDRPAIRLRRSAPENSCRPAVDPMLRSLAAVYGGSLCAVILSGTGQDGLAGARAVRERGGLIIAQDEASSVVWGMPGAVVGQGLADHVMSVPELVGFLGARLAGPHPTNA